MPVPLISRTEREEVYELLERLQEFFSNDAVIHGGAMLFANDETVGQRVTRLLEQWGRKPNA